jgi:hypothetical protein
MDKAREYELLGQLERETTATRHATFTAILGVSFVLPGLAVQATNVCAIDMLGFTTSVCSLVFLLGFVFYLFAVFHYHWYHRHAHAYRKRLKELERELGIQVYSLRTRPQVGRMKLHFEWALHIIGAIYAVATVAFVGWQVFLAGLFVVVVPYLLLMATSIHAPVEPMEQR